MSGSYYEEEKPIFIDEEHDKYADCALKSIDISFMQPRRADNLALARINKDLISRTLTEPGPITVR